MRYYLNSEPDPQADEKIAAINHLYQTAQQRAERGEAVVSTDEMTGVQALEPKHPDLPMLAGHVLRREFEYIRHGTLSFIVNFMWRRAKSDRSRLARHARKKIFSLISGALLKLTLTSCNGISSWTISTLTSLNPWSATWPRSPIWTSTWGAKVTPAFWLRGRAALLFSLTPPIVFHYTPTHASWMNQIEIWFSILMRKLLKRAIADLKAKVLAFVAYFNRTMAKPFRWTYQGKALTV